MSAAAISQLANEALAILEDASDRVSMAILFRDFALNGEIERAMAVRDYLKRLDPATLEMIACRVSGLDNSMLHQDKLAAFIRSMEVEP